MNQLYKTYNLLLLIAILLVSACSKKEDLNDLNSTEKTSLSDSNYVSLKQATVFASSTVRENTKGKLTLSIEGTNEKIIDKQKTVVGEDGKNAYYIISYKGGGFVILSADRRTSSILAYSDTSPFPLDSVPLGLNLWLSETRDKIDELRELNTPYTGQDQVPVLSSQVARRPPPDPVDSCNTYIVTKGPYMTTTWNQIGGYNNMMPQMSCTPFSNNGRAYTGCVATAMAQVIKYHQHPSSYNYTIMSNAVPYYDVSSSANEISRLMYNAAVSVNSSYDCNGTGAASEVNDIVNALKNTFGYASTAQKLNFDYQTVENELNAGRPVIMTGYTTQTGWILHSYSGGHCWVADGYQRSSLCGNMYLFFHMNWGWGGEHNGWFGLTNANSGNGNYQYKRQMVVGIRKP